VAAKNVRPDGETDNPGELTASVTGIIIGELLAPGADSVIVAL